MLLICTEAKNGNIFDYDATVSAYCVETGARIFSRPNIPFDVCACWIPNTKIFIHGESLTVSPRGTYHQVLAMYDCDSQRVIGRFHFRFIGEAFVHLIQVSPDGNFLALTCGLGDGLSDMVRVVRIPDLRRAIDGKSCFEIRVPRNKFTHASLLASAATTAEPGNGNNHLVNTLSTSPLTASMPISKLISLSPPSGDGDNVVPSFFCGGAVLGLCWSRDSRNFYTNTRLYRRTPVAGLTTSLPDRPDLDNTLEVQVWSIESLTPSSRIRGAHGFTTKDCPFYLFLSESPCGEYVASGSEDCGVYLYHVRHGKLMRILSEHTDVVSMVTWGNVDRNSCVLASASDDHKICLWGGAMQAFEAAAVEDTGTSQILNKLTTMTRNRTLIISAPITKRQRFASSSS